VVIHAWNATKLGLERLPFVCLMRCMKHVINSCLWFLHPVIILPDWVCQKKLDQGRPPQSTGQRQVSLRRLLDIVNEFGSTKPALLAFHVAVLRGPSNLLAKDFEIALGLSPLFLLDRVAELAARKLEPQPFDRSHIRVGNSLHVSKVHKGTALCFGAGKLDQSISCELCIVAKREKA
jgi:hypothetical protein